MSNSSLRPAVSDVVVYRLGAKGNRLRWLVTRGDSHQFEFDDEAAAIQYACSRALTSRVRCFLDDEDGVRRVYCPKVNDTNVV